MDNTDKTQQSQDDQTTKPISDDQELAKVLAGIGQEFKETKTDTNKDDKEIINTPETPTIPPMPPLPAMPVPDMPKNDDKNPMPEIKMPDLSSMMPPVPPTPANSNLDSIRKDALLELKPLIGKLDLAPEEKFDIYLLLLRSTDDTTLIAPAHEAAKNIADEGKRAEALLDIIKEIDFLSAPNRSE